MHFYIIQHNRFHGYLSYICNRVEVAVALAGSRAPDFRFTNIDSDIEEFSKQWELSTVRGGNPNAVVINVKKAENIGIFVK